MADQAVISTRYANLPNGDLYAMYRGETWRTLDEAARLDLLQETASRVALEHGDPNPVTVSFADLPDGVGGTENRHAVQLSRGKFVNETVSVEDEGTVVQMSVTDANYQALEAVLHESRHSVQESIIAGEAGAPESVRDALTANDTTIAFVDGHLGSRYLDGQTGYEYYYCQPCEIDAYRYSQEKTQSIIENLRSEYGTDASMEEYLGNLSEKGFQAYLDAYNAKYGVDFESELSKSLQNAYPSFQHQNVDPQIEQNVRNEMIKTFEASQNNTYGGKPMMNPDKGYTPVTQAQFDAQMKATTNAFYEHALNDPTMTHEEAIAETGKVAERGIIASEEFAQEAAREAANNAAETSVGESAAVSSGEGMSAGGEGASNGASASAGVGM